MKHQARSLSIGISVSDYCEPRGHIESSVYDLVDHIEYGGFGSPENDPGLRRIRDRQADMPFGRHLVSTELPGQISVNSEVERIRKDIEGLDAQYMLTDFEFWHLGGRGGKHVWARPCPLDRQVAQTVIRNCRALEQELGCPIFPENPALVFVEGELTLPDFLRELADAGLGLCLDVGHFFAACYNSGMDVAKSFERIPFDSIRVSHIAGLGKIEYSGEALLLDNHTIPPRQDCVDLLQEVIARSENLSWVTYEAELASTDVQLAGLQALGRSIQ